MAANGMFGVGNNGLIKPPNPNRMFTLKTAEIACFNRDRWRLLLEFTLLVDMAKHLPKESSRRAQALFTGNQIANICWPGDLSKNETIKEALDISRAFLSQKNGESQHNLSVIGHCHIDTAWLWPYAETRRKTARSWSTALRYMEDPDYASIPYLFTCSQAQQYAWLKEDYPVLFERLIKAVSQGTFVPTGGTWVEMDCNIPSGESFCRQFLYGQRFFKEHFGKRCTEFWLPDTFGYSAQLPQIIREADLESFLTQKLSWNLFNKIPHSSFLWEGIDGTKVFTHFPPADNYNCQVHVEEVIKSVENYKDKDRSKESLMVLGHGDGGGGPQYEMLERIKMLKDCDGLPRLEMRSPKAFFDRLKQDIKEPLTWSGELYFELHQGTYTTQALVKRQNRKIELLLRDLELLATITTFTKGFDYPKEKLEYCWKKLLLQQFHDVIPGSSIGLVYDDCHRDHEEICGIANNLVDEQFASLQNANSLPYQQDGSVMVFNSLSWERKELIEISGLDSSLTAQISHNGNSLVYVTAPPLSLQVVKLNIRTQTKSDDVATASSQGSDFILENKLVCCRFNQQGILVSMFDKEHQREVIQSQGMARGANEMILYDDVPFFWDAWDVLVFHLEKKIVVESKRKIQILETGPLRATIQIEFALSDKSSIKQIVSLTSLSKSLSFDCEVDWHETHKFLKVLFPLNVRNDTANYEIQYGYVKRPTHMNTSWDVARFEVCGHRFADLSEYDYGVSILNDCKYGYSCFGSVMSLSLLRSPKQPDDNADMHKHFFKYAIYPHSNSFPTPEVVRQSHSYNSPLRTKSINTTDISPLSYFTVDKPNVIIDSVKLSEDSKTSIVIRLYEALGGRGRVTLTSNVFRFSSVARCNILEDDLKEETSSLQINSDKSVTFEITPFKIVTLKLNVK
eukprot:TRINITY_DN2753_c0_g1_i1.p1 TRINITY_DN2753_c0_g1~~TRINITY_DN2753_c0_g1_i1.p1  ORF type:complete len:910 (-),score=210.70 TRINITY_DN2753_c0_g1_i1:94-2823(-)